jgi:hypothetical protein
MRIRSREQSSSSGSSDSVVVVISGKRGFPAGQLMTSCFYTTIRIEYITRCIATISGHKIPFFLVLPFIYDELLPIPIPI